MRESLSSEVKIALIKFNIKFLIIFSIFDSTPLQYSCLENSMDGEAWWATVHGVAKNWTRLSNFT